MPISADAGIDYFENSHRATASQRVYAIANPSGFTGYAEQHLGLTACDESADVVTAPSGARTGGSKTYAARRWLRWTG